MATVLLEEIRNHYIGKVDAIFHNGDSELPSDDEGMARDSGCCREYGLLRRLSERLVTDFGGDHNCSDSWPSLPISTFLFKSWICGQEVNADICLYGHLHIPDARMEGKTLFLNPGSISQPRGLINNASTLGRD